MVEKGISQYLHFLSIISLSCTTRPIEIILVKTILYLYYHIELMTLKTNHSSMTLTPTLKHKMHLRLYLRVLHHVRWNYDLHIISIWKLSMAWGDAIGVSNWQGVNLEWLILVVVNLTVSGINWIPTAEHFCAGFA